MIEIRVATASWTIPARLASAFGDGDSVLRRYASRFDAVEVNSSFYRSHRPQTYRRWAASVPDGFRFAIKMPRRITHEHRLLGTEAELLVFLDEVGELGEKLGPILVQLPPSLRFDAGPAEKFMTVLRDRFDGEVACEPRHASWFTDEAETLLADRRIARVAADPPPVPEAAEPAGWAELAYFRLHGSPRIYYSDYGAVGLEALATRVRAMAARTIWCVFDNTALGAATDNALSFGPILLGGGGDFPRLIPTGIGNEVLASANARRR